jgi:hypothetical protein
VSHTVQAEAQKNTAQESWIAGHERWTDTVYGEVIGRIARVDDRLTEKSDALETQIVVQTESLGQWRREKNESDKEWRDELREHNREMIEILRDLQGRKSP